MPTFDISLERCQQLQMKLRSMLQGSSDPDLCFLLQKIDSACLTVTPTIPASPQDSPDRGKKRSATKKIKTASHPHKLMKTNEMSAVSSSRNDSRRRGMDYRRLEEDTVNINRGEYLVTERRILLLIRQGKTPKIPKESPSPPMQILWA
jgi:hypothetical protein